MDRVAQYFISLFDLGKPRLQQFIIRFVGMIEQRQLPVSFFYFCRAGVEVQVEYFIIILQQANVLTEPFGAVSVQRMTKIIVCGFYLVDFWGIKYLLMTTNFTRQHMPEGYEICGVGAAPEEDSLVVMSDEAIRKLRGKPGFLRRWFSGPYELSGTGADYKESGFMIQEMIERGIRK